MSSMSQLLGELRSFIASHPTPNSSAIHELLFLLRKAQEASPEEYEATWIPYLKKSIASLKLDLPLIEEKHPQTLAHYAQLIPLPIWEFKGMWLSGSKTLDVLIHDIGEHLYSLRLQECNLNETKLVKLLSDASLKHIQEVKISGLQEHVVTAQHIHALAESPSASTFQRLCHDR